MIRTALAVYLAVVTAAGPWLCCCTGARLVADLRRAAPSPPAATEQDRPTCCCHTPAKATDGPAVSPGTAPATPTVPGPSCPCREGRAALAAAPVDTVKPAVESLSDGGVVFLSPPPFAHFTVAADSACRAGGDGPPPLSAPDRLCLLQILRC